MVATVGTSIFDWIQFWEMVKNHTAWDLEWYDGTNWISVKNDLTILKNYPTEDKCKTSLIFDASQAGNYRLTFAVDVKVRNYVDKVGEYQYILTYDDFEIIFDWSDIIGISGLQITHGVKEVAGEKYFWFRMRKDGVPKGAHLEIDPSIVGTSTYTHPVLFAFEKKCFYANGRWWAWYNDTSARFGWKTSPDGIDWTGAYTLYYASLQYYDLWYDEANNKICLARSQGTAANIYYRQGTANADGTITWDSAEVLVTTNTGHGVTLCKDSNGYPWVGYRINGAPSDAKVVKATTTSGSSWGTPTTLWAVNTRLAKILPLTGGKMLAISSGVSMVIQSRLFTGSSWETAVNASTSTTTPSEFLFDAVADGDNVHLAFCKATSYDIIYVKYVYGTGWGSEETVDTATIYNHHPCMTFKSTDKVRVFYFKSTTTIKYRDRDDGSWQTAVTISSTESTMTSMSSSYKPFSSKFCVLWKSGAASPYDVKFEGYTLEEAIAKAFSDVGGGSDAFLNPYRAMPFSDVGQGAEAFNTPFRSMGFADAGLGSDAFIKEILGAIEKAFADAGYGTDAFLIPFRAMKFDDTGHGSEVFNTFFRSMGFADVGNGVDLFTLLRMLAFTDVGSGTDAFTKEIITAILKAFSDLGLGSDAFIKEILAEILKGDAWLGPPVPRPTFPVYLLTLIRDYLETKQEVNADG